MTERGQLPGASGLARALGWRRCKQIQSAGAMLSEVTASFKSYCVPGCNKRLKRMEQNSGSSAKERNTISDRKTRSANEPQQVRGLASRGRVNFALKRGI